MSAKNIQMIQEVAKGLGNLKDDVVFVGGATVSLYLDLDVADEVRPTEDVDVVIEISSKIDYQKLSEKLLSMKFTPDSSKGAPICRWKYLGLTVDIMPIDEDILGFSNRFYKDGFTHKQSVTLPDGQEIFVFSLGYFLASKLEAYFGRGADDPRFSSDLEDIVTVLSDATNFETITDELELKSYFNQTLKKLFTEADTVEAIKGFLLGPVTGRYEYLLNRVKKLSDLSD